jgi:UDP-N-acetylglucosamine 2-epimerase (non-hydrolysing)
MRVLSIFGTRPEAIKMAPLVSQLAQTPGIESVVCTTGQHKSMLDQVMALFDIKADHNLDVMVNNQTLNGLSQRLLERLDPVLDAVKPDRVLVHGDTTSAMISSLAAFHRGIPVGHVEAGLRTGNMLQPWPEEMNRRVVDVVSDVMFAPTAVSKQNLIAENLSGQILVTGNTVIDALQTVVYRLD